MKNTDIKKKGEKIEYYISKDGSMRFDGKNHKAPNLDKSIKCKPFYVISSKKFGSLDRAIAQMFEWEQNKTLSPKAVIYKVAEIIKYKRVPKLCPLKKK